MRSAGLYLRHGGGNDGPDGAAMGIEGIFVIDPATDAYYIYQRGGLDPLGARSIVGGCEIHFDEIKGLLA